MSTWPLCFQKIAAGTSGLCTMQVKFSTDLNNFICYFKIRFFKRFIQPFAVNIIWLTFGIMYMDMLTLNLYYWDKKVIAHLKSLTNRFGCGEIYKCNSFICKK